jgi:hypothetical protein
LHLDPNPEQIRHLMASGVTTIVNEPPPMLRKTAPAQGTTKDAMGELFTELDSRTGSLLKPSRTDLCGWSAGLVFAPFTIKITIKNAPFS